MSQQFIEKIQRDFSDERKRLESELRRVIEAQRVIDPRTRPRRKRVKDNG